MTGKEKWDSTNTEDLREIRDTENQDKLGS